MLNDCFNDDVEDEVDNVRAPPLTPNPPQLQEHTDLKDLWQLACHMWLKDWPKLNQCLLTQQHPPHLSIYINQLIS